MIKGHITHAEIIERADDRDYKLRAKVAVGKFTGVECLVGHKGKPEQKKGDMILVRFDDPYPDRKDVKVPTAYFITSKEAGPVTSLYSEKVLFFGIWEERMKGGYEYPNLGSISDFYRIGTYTEILHFMNDNGLIVPFKVGVAKAPRMMKYPTGSPHRFTYAIELYINDMNMRDISSPRVMTIEPGIENIVLNNISNIKQDKGLMLLEMEPQR